MSLPAEIPVCHHDSCRVEALVELGFDAQACIRSRVPDEVDDGLEGPQRLAAPVLGDVAEETMVDPVPLARARRRVRDPDAELQVVGKIL
jgi:hypothetical protein